MENVPAVLGELLPTCLAELVWSFAREIPEPFVSFTFDRRWFAKAPEYDAEGVYGGYSHDLTTLPGLALYSW